MNNPSIVDDRMQQRIGYGLRQMKREPDALVFVDDLMDLTWDLPTAYDIPVFHSAGFLPPGWGSSTPDCPFFPVWHTDYPEAAVECARFVKGYCEQ